MRRTEAIGCTLTVTDAARRLIAEKGYDAEYGARPLRRTIQRLIEDELSLLLIEPDGERPKSITADAADGKIVFSKNE